MWHLSVSLWLRVFFLPLPNVRTTVSTLVPPTWSWHLTLKLADYPQYSFCYFNSPLQWKVTHYTFLEIMLWMSLEALLLPTINFFSIIYSMVSQKCPYVKESNYVFLNKYHMMSFMNLYKSEQRIFLLILIIFYWLIYFLLLFASSPYTPLHQNFKKSFKNT